MTHENKKACTCEPNFNIRKIQKDCYDITTEKGFDLSQTQLQLLLIADEAFEAMREVEEPIHGDNKLLIAHNSAMDLAKNLSDIVRDKNYYPESTKILNKSNFAEELADVVIRVMSLAGHHKIDIGAEILKKQEKNKKREIRHGKER